MLADDRKIGCRYHAAVEAADWRRDLEGPEQWAQPSGRAATDDGKNNSARTQLSHSGHGARCQPLFIIDQRAIDIRDHSRTFEWQRMRSGHDDFPSSWPSMLRQLRPSWARSSSASPGPGLPAG